MRTHKNILIYKTMWRTPFCKLLVLNTNVWLCVRACLDNPSTVVPHSIPKKTDHAKMGDEYVSKFAELSSKEKMGM